MPKLTKGEMESTALYHSPTLLEQKRFNFAISNRMTDLTYCYIHMRRNDFLILDTIETLDYLDETLEDEENRDIPSHMIPPNPEDSATALPSHIHPSFPFGDPSHEKHPSKKPRPPYDPSSRALFEDMGYGGGGVNESLRWLDLGLDDLLPVDEDKELAKRAAQARKMASGASNHNPQTQQQAHAPQMQQPDDDEEEEEEEDENDENNHEDFEEDEEVEEEEEESEGDEE